MSMVELIRTNCPPLDDRTILCLQAGEVNAGEFDRFAMLIPKAKAAGAWVHIDGAFGLWARASSKAALTVVVIQNKNIGHSLIPEVRDL